MTGVPAHAPVMVEEAVAGLKVQQAGTYVDATFGRGGHARAILARLGPEGRLLALDRDPEAVAAATTLGDPRSAVRDPARAVQRAGQGA